MPRCPVCESRRIVIVVSPERRGFCVECGSRWKQRGGSQTHIEYGEYRRARQRAASNTAQGDT